MKKLLSFILIMLICISQMGFRTEAFYDSGKHEVNVEEQSDHQTVEEIMDEYLSAVNKIKISMYTQGAPFTLQSEEINELVSQRNLALQINGYTVHEVNSEN